MQDIFTNDLYHANFFFFFTTVVVGVIGVFVILIAAIVTKILLDIMFITRKVRKNVDAFFEAANAFTSAAKSGLGGLVGFVTSFIGSRVAGKRTRKKAS